MSDVAVTEGLFAELHRDATHVVGNAILGGDAPAGAARLEPMMVISFVALQILVPILVSAVSDLTMDTIRERRANARTEAKLRALGGEAVGRRFRPVAPEDRNELLHWAIVDLEAAGATPDAPRAAVERIFAAVEVHVG